MPASRVNKILEVLNPALVITTAALKETFSNYEYQGGFLLFEEASHAAVSEEKIEAAIRQIHVPKCFQLRHNDERRRNPEDRVNLFLFQIFQQKHRLRENCCLRKPAMLLSVRKK